MRYKKRLPDGTVEIQPSGKACPPGFTGQAGNVSSVWFRVDSGEWEPAARSMHLSVEVLECANSVAEFRKLLGIV